MSRGFAPVIVTVDPVYRLRAKDGLPAPRKTNKALRNISKPCHRREHGSSEDDFASGGNQHVPAVPTYASCRKENPPPSSIVESEKFAVSEAIVLMTA
jgi:hypothetical protein